KPLAILTTSSHITTLGQTTTHILSKSAPCPPQNHIPLLTIQPINNRNNIHVALLTTGLQHHNRISPSHYRRHTNSLRITNSHHIKSSTHNFIITFIVEESSEAMEESTMSSVVVVVATVAAETEVRPVTRRRER
ncbi:hypothetical protein AKJ16_DCAP16008, partial [Drosera capensis]